ncbi:mercuric transport protein [Acrasis kona]|uniref:Mercuric transport protein n=1 Tax=Acrasis kona TaxID=1008807 RepID=A0AAW2ZLR1_9EUKA
MLNHMTSFSKLNGASLLSALFASSCCVVQLAMNYAGLSCAGFSIFAPYRAVFLSATLGVLVIKWLNYFSNRKSLKSALSLIAYTCTVISIAYSDRIISGELPSDKNTTIMHVGVSNKQEILDVRDLITKHDKFQYAPNTLATSSSLNQTCFTFTSLKSRSDLDEAELENILGHGATVILGMSHKIHRTLPSGQVFCIKLNNVKCAGCFSSSVKILGSEEMTTKFKVIESQYDPSVKSALFYIQPSTNFNLNTLTQDINNQIISNNKKFEATKVLQIN